MRFSTGFSCAVVAGVLLISVAATPSEAQGRMYGQNRMHGERRANGMAGMGNGMGYGMGAKMSMPDLRNHPLTSAQRRQIGTIRQDAQRQMRNTRNKAGLTAEQRQEQMAKMRADTHARVMNVLTTEQKQEFEDSWTSRPGSGMGRGM
jgi:Spy/CpxP family protein refolding chaperone